MYAVHVNAIQLSLKFTCDCLVALSFNKYQWNIRGESTVLEGDNLQLLCKVSSRVEPNITWTKEKPGNQGNTGVVQEGKVLTITNINRTDAGTFTCTTCNGFGKPEKRTVFPFISCVLKYCAVIYLY